MPDATSNRPSSADEPSIDTHADHLEMRQRGGGAQPAPDFRSPRWRLGNAIVSGLARAGIGPFHLLAVRGRRTGRLHTVLVVLVEHDGGRWLVAPYGPTSWVHDARVAGQVRLRRGRTTSDHAVREAGPDEAGPVRKR